MKVKYRVCVCVCVYYSLLLRVHLKWYLRRNRGKEECRQCTYRWGAGIAHLIWHSDQAVVLMIWEFDSKQKRFSSFPEHSDWL